MPSPSRSCSRRRGSLAWGARSSTVAPVSGSTSCRGRGMRRRKVWPSTCTDSHRPSGSFSLRGIRAASSAGRAHVNRSRGSTRCESPELAQILVMPQILVMSCLPARAPTSKTQFSIYASVPPFDGRDDVTLRDRTAVVGIGATPYYRRGASVPETEMSMMCTAILAALDDAGLAVTDLDGFAIYSSACDPALVGSVLGVPEIRFAAGLTSGGGGSAGQLGLAAAAIVSGQADVVVSLMSLQQAKRRLGGTEVDGRLAYLMAAGGGPYGGGGVQPSAAFSASSGLIAPGHSFAVL